MTHPLWPEESRRRERWESHPTSNGVNSLNENQEFFISNIFNTVPDPDSLWLNSIQSVFQSKRSFDSSWREYLEENTKLNGKSYFRTYPFSSDKTGSRHFQRIIPNIFIRKSTIPRQMSALSTSFGVLPVSEVKSEMGIVSPNFVFSSKYSGQDASNELSQTLI